MSWPRIIFCVTRGATVVFKDLAIRDCLLNDAFAVILVRGGSSVTLDNVEVTDVRNVAAPGVVYSLDSTVKIISSVFKNNRGYDGAILYAQRSDITISGCDFMNNLAYDDGVAIWAEDCSTSIEECMFRDNKADYSGGAVFAKVLTAQTGILMSLQSSGCVGWNVNGQNIQIREQRSLVRRRD